MPRRIQPNNWMNAGFSGEVDPLDLEQQAAISKALGVDKISDDVDTTLRRALGELIENIRNDRDRPTARESKTALESIQSNAQKLQRELFGLDANSQDFLLGQLMKQQGKDAHATYAEIDNLMERLKKLSRAAGSASRDVDEKVETKSGIVSHRHKFTPPPTRPLRIFITELVNIYQKKTGKKPTSYYSDNYKTKGEFFIFVKNCLTCLPINIYGKIYHSNAALAQTIKEVLRTY